MITDQPTAILDPHALNYWSWFKILDSDFVPLVSYTTEFADVGELKGLPVYRLDLRRITLNQRVNLVAHLAQLFGWAVVDVEAELNQNGFPILASDLIIHKEAKAVM